MLFPWYTKYPYQNDEVLNLDWILKTIENLVKEVADFVTLNTIKYADPIQWNITTQYEKNTVVIDPISGSAYISTKPVPAGVGLNNTDYWNIIFTLDVISANKNITLRDDANNMLATFESEVGDWLLWQGTLYVVTQAIQIGQAYVVDYNIERATVEAFLKLYIENLKDYTETLIGDLDDLESSVKTDLVSAINSVISAYETLIGDLTDLTTEDKDSVVDAINEIVGAISGVSEVIGSLENLDTTVKTSIVASINEVVGYIGDLDDLDTTVKTDLVSAINEALNAIPTLIYPNVAALLADTNIIDGIYQTAGYYLAGDMGAAKYNINSSGTVDGITVLSCSNGKKAHLIIESCMNIKAFGAKGDDSTDDYAVFAAALSNCETVLVPPDNYVIGTTLVLYNNALVGVYDGQSETELPVLKCIGLQVEFKGNCLKNLHLIDTQNYTHTAIELKGHGDGHSNHMNNFENLIIDNFDEAILFNGVVWNNVFTRIRTNFCNYGVYKSDSYDCFGNTFINFYTSGSKVANIFVNRFGAIFIDGIFGFSCMASIRITSNSSVTFLNCNFECDAHISQASSDGFESLIYISGRSATFENCYFTPNIEATFSLFQTGAGIQEFNLRGCQYITVSGNLSDYVFRTGAVPAANYGAIHLDTGCSSFPTQFSGSHVIENSYKPYLVYDYVRECLTTNGTGSLDTTKLGEGRLVYDISDHTYKYYNGTNVVSV